MYHKLATLLVVLSALITGCTEPAKPLSNLESVRQQMADIDRGRYVIEVMGCNDCHTPDYLVRRSKVPEEDWLVGSTLGFRGQFGTVYPTNLRLLLNSLSEEDWLPLARKMRERAPMADVMLPNAMNQDLRAIYKFVKYLGPKGTPAPNRLPKGVTPTTQYIEITDQPH